MRSGGKIMKKISQLFLSFLLVLTLAGCSSKPAESGSTFKAGTYTAEAMGNNAPVKVEVTVSEDTIEKIVVLEHKETPSISDLALSEMPTKIVEVQGLGVDTISGATVTSNAILEAVALALEEAGADIEALKKISEKEVAKAEDVEYTADVVVIGAGGAGMAAAVTANQEGASVIIIEKMPRVGGNTILAGGALNAVDEGSETALANADSVELHYNQTYEGGDKKGDPELVRQLVTNAWDGVEWLQSLGMEFQEGTFTVLGGMWPRAHKPVEPVGTGFFNAYQNYIDTNENIELQLEVTAKEFIVKDGEVIGVVAEGKTGNKVTLYANNGVVLATGGFGQNIEMRQEYNTMWKNLDGSIKSTNHSGATGDGIELAKKVNAQLVQMENIQLLPMGDPETGSLSGNIEMAVENRIFVNDQGNRFVDEGARRDVMTSALFEQPNAHMWTILDSHDYPTGEEVNNFNESMNQLIKDNRAFKGDTLEELAEKIGVDPKNLVSAVEGFNSHVDAKSADEFGRTLYKDPINQGPYYAAARIPTVHHTMGGVKINTDAQVIGEDGNIISGLYAAGEVTGGIHGANRLGGNALTDTVVFGRIAGLSAAKNK